MLLADLHRENTDAASDVLSDAGFENSTMTVDVSEREWVLALGEIGFPGKGVRARDLHLQLQPVQVELIRRWFDRAV